MSSTRVRSCLRVELTAVLVVKLCLLAGLWFAFVRDAGVAIDADAVARRASLSDSPTISQDNIHDR
ncbi:MAG: cytochrome oxidase putative small subunit CydP [Roseiarcus sp.]